MQTMTYREVLRTKGFKTMSIGFGIAVIGVVFAALGLILIAQVLVVAGILTGIVGFAMHLWLFFSTFRRKLRER